MSATGRGKERNARDFYPTPEYAFKNLLPMLPHESTYWEPACGDGRLVRWMNESGYKCAGTDLALGDDFLRDDAKRDFIITNPPFSLALQFCEHALAHSSEFLFLLPLNFLGSIKRRDWLSRHEPNAIFVIVPRPSFGLNKHGKKGTDANEYGWFYWGGRWSGIKHLYPPCSAS